MSNRVGIEFKQIWALLSDSEAPAPGTVPPTCDTKVEGVRCEFKKNWLKLFAKNGMRMYVARQKVTRQIDLSGWDGKTKGLVGVFPAEKKNGQVEAHVDMSDEKALFHIVGLLSMMASLPDPVKAKKAPHRVERTEKEESERKERQARASSPDAKTGTGISKGDREAATQRLLFIWEACRGRNVLPSEATIEKWVSAGASMPDDLKAAIENEKALRAGAQAEPAKDYEAVLAFQENGTVPDGV